MSLFNLIVNLRNEEKFHEFMSRSVECWMEWMASAAKKFLKITRTQVCKAKMRTYLEIFWKLKNWGKIQLGTFRTGPKCWQLWHKWWQFSSEELRKVDSDVVTPRRGDIAIEPCRTTVLFIKISHGQFYNCAYLQIIPIKNGRRDCDNLLADANDMSAPNYKYNHCVLLC